MQSIKQFIEQFITAEYDFSCAEYSMEITDEACQKIAAKVNALIYYLQYERVASIAERKGDEQWEQRCKMKVEKIIPRTLFQIKHYENPVLGDALKRIVTGKDIYGCYVSYPYKGGRDLYFSSIFYVAETNEGLKIIYKKSFNSDAGTWYHPVDLDTVTVIDEGQLIAVEKYLAPEEATSLEDYNKE
ncbi:MAG: hypothetical protein KF704_09740 [Crocinitomicaceae bacterium]|nr:hypothetical protein [Crocinitomicaceae bacterium]